MFEGFHLHQLFGFLLLYPAISTRGRFGYLLPSGMVVVEGQPVAENRRDEAIAEFRICQCRNLNKIQAGFYAFMRGS